MLSGYTRKNTFVVADFDRTITDGLPDCATAFGVFPRAIGEIKVEAKKLFDTYFPLEICTEISEEERSSHMREWNEKVMELLGECINESQMQEILKYAEKEIIIRGGVKEALQELEHKGVPVIIFSAGVSNVIEAVLDFHNISHSGIHSNDLGFVDGRLQLINEGVYIGNKGWESLPQGIKNSVSDRTHKLILGDSLDDLYMGDTQRVTTSIGFLNSEQIKKGRRAEYHEAYDHVIESDVCDKGLLGEIISSIR